MKKRFTQTVAILAILVTAGTGLVPTPASAAPWEQTNAAECVTELSGNSGWFGYHMKFRNDCKGDIIARLDCPWVRDKKMTIKKGETGIFYGCGGFTPRGTYYGNQ